MKELRMSWDSLVYMIIEFRMNLARIGLEFNKIENEMGWIVLVYNKIENEL